MEKKGQFNFTIDEDLLKRFKELSKKYAINKALLISNFIQNWVNEREKNKNA
jgi:metal-responsive CopG/Arc/MetJ family transcriptional regulator